MVRTGSTPAQARREWDLPQWYELHRYLRHHPPGEWLMAARYGYEPPPDLELLPTLDQFDAIERAVIDHLPAHLKHIH